MDFQHDLAMMAKDELMDSGIDVPDDWDDYHICLNYYEISMRWFDSSVPYVVVYSKELTEKISTLSNDEQNAIKEIEYNLNNCKPLTPYMSKLIRSTDMRRSDFLLKNWNIYHLHLEKLTPPKQNFTKPNLLFIQPKGRVVHFIDVKHHPRGNTWFDRSLLEVAYKNWPWLFITLGELKSVVDIPDEKVHDLTKFAVTAIDICGQSVFPSNLGVASSGHSSISVRATDRIFNYLKKVELELVEQKTQIRANILKETGCNIEDELEFELVVENGYFVAYEKHAKVKQKLAKVNIW